MKYIDDSYYHIYNRGAHKGMIFFSQENYRYCIRLLEKYTSPYQVHLAAYCLMPNHYHLILHQQSSGSISRFLQTTFNSYSQAVNKQRSFSGTLFEGRAKGILVDSDRYLLQLIRYIHLNPVLAGLINHPEAWEFSDYQEWISHTSETFSGKLLRDCYFQNGEEYKNFVDQYQHEKEQELLSKYLYDDE